MLHLGIVLYNTIMPMSMFFLHKLAKRRYSRFTDTPAMSVIFIIRGGIKSKFAQILLTNYEQYVNIYLYTHANVNKLLTKLRKTSKDLLVAR